MKELLIEAVKFPEWVCVRCYDDDGKRLPDRVYVPVGVRGLGMPLSDETLRMMSEHTGPPDA